MRLKYQEVVVEPVTNFRNLADEFDYHRDYVRKKFTLSTRELGGVTIVDPVPT